LTEQLRLHDPQESTIKQEDETESKDSIILSQGDLDAIKMLDLDFDTSQLMMPFGVDTGDLDIDKFKVEDEVQQQQQQQQQTATATSTTASALITTSAAAPNYTFNEQMLNSPQTKMAHKIKVRKQQRQILDTTSLSKDASLCIEILRGCLGLI